MSDQATQRNNTVDIAKGIGILLVVMGHNWISSEDYLELNRIIYSFHMPLFFVLSGVFFTPDKYSLRKTLTNKADTLLKPYFFPLLGIIAIHSITGKVDFLTGLIGIFYACGETIPWTAMWFLPQLFVVTLFSHIICRHIRTNYNRILLIIVLLVINIKFLDFFRGIPFSWQGEMYYTPGLPLCLDFIGISTFFFFMGMLMKRHILNLKFEPIAFIASLFIFGVFHYNFDFDLDLNKRVYDGYIVTTAQALLGIYLAIAMSNCLAKSSKIATPMAYLGRASLFVLIFHMFFQYKSYMVFTKYLGWDHAIAALTAFVVAVAAPLALFQVVRRIDIIALFLLPLKTNKLYEKRFASS